MSTLSTQTLLIPYKRAVYCMYTRVELHYTLNAFKFCDSYHSVPFGPYPRYFAFVAFFL